MSTVLIAGASRGIGLELAKQYASNGDDVIACVRDTGAASQLDEAASGADNIEIQQLDVGDPGSIEAAAAAIGDRAIDTLIISAGAVGGGRQTLDDLDLEEWHRTLDTNTIGPALVAKAFKSNLIAAGESNLMILSSQLAIAKGEEWYVQFFRGFDRLFTFGANIGTAASDAPIGEFDWQHTWQPVVSRDWHTRLPPAHDRFTTVMTWHTESFTDVDGNKDREFVRFIDLPSKTRCRFELAVNGPQSLLRDHGWAPVDAMRVSRSLWDYRDFIQCSKAEFGVAKHAYVARRSGWFSDRTACYLTAGRPAVVQDTGWSAHLPSGPGLIGFETAAEALAGLEHIERDYAAHARGAREIADACFDAARVLPPFLERACA